MKEPTDTKFDQDYIQNMDLKLEVFSLREKVEDMNERFEKLESKIEGLVSAWNTAQNLSNFVGWSTKTLAGVGVLWYALTHWKLPS